MEKVNKLVEIRVEFYIGEHSPITLTLPDGATIKQVHTALEKVCDLDFKQNVYLLIVDGVVRSDSYALSSGDTVVAMQSLPGG